MKKLARYLLLLAAMGLGFVFASCKADDDDDTSQPPVYYTVSFNSNGGTEVKSQKVESGKKATKPANPTKQAISTETYAFENWYTSTDNGTTLSDTAFDFNTPITKDITLYAKWAVNAVTHTVTFDTKGGSTSPAEQTIVHGKKATKPADPKKQATETETYTFDNWYTSIDGGATLSDTAFDFDTAITDNITLYAKWTVNAVTHTVTFDTKGGSTSPAEQTIVHGNKATKPADPTKQATETETYAFDNWYTSTDGGTSLSDTAFDFDTAITKDIILYAKWTATAITHTVTFNTNGGSTAPAEQTIVHGNKAAKPTNPTKTATEAETYAFDNWYTSTDGGATLSDTAFDFDTAIKGDITLYAKWTVNAVTHTVTFDTKGGSTSPAEQTIVHGNKATRPTDPTKEETATEAFVFDNWYTSTDGGTSLSDTAFNFDTEITEDIKLYAKWNTKALYKVSYTTEYGTTPSTITVEENSILTDNQLPKLSYYDGYTFNGWYDDNTEALPKKYMVTKNVTLTAKWDVPKAIPLKTCYTIHKLFFKLAGSEPHPWIGGWTINKTVIRFVKSTTKPENVLYYLDKGEKEVPLWYDESVTTLYYYIPEGRALGLTVSREDVENALFKNMQKLEYIDTCDFDTSNVTDMTAMFSGCYALTSLDVSNFDTSKVTDMSSMFSGCDSLTALDVSNFDTSKVTDMSSMFSDCDSLTALDVSNFDTSNVTDMRWMFDGCDSLTTIYASDKFVTEAVQTSDNMFFFSNELKGGAGTKYDSDKIDKEYARIDGGTENPGYFTAKTN